MRLSASEVQHIVQAAQEVFPAADFHALWLFGSRANPSKKGGDIDLWIELQREPPDAERTQLRRKLRQSLEDRLGPQKFDLLITGPLEEVADAAKRAFLEQIKSERVQLWPPR
jgi:predicted nucleotidyltransferase